MPASNHEKIASALKLAWPRLIIVILVTLIVTLLLSFRTRAPSQGACIPRNLRSTDSSCIFLEYATTPLEQKKGLGGRAELASDRGMLFIFDDGLEHCFWMKDMQFAIDIVWLNEDKVIIAKEVNVSPETYPHSFCPGQPSKYVIEVKSGVASGWDLGESVGF